MWIDKYVTSDIFIFSPDKNKNKQREAAYFAIGSGSCSQAATANPISGSTCTKRMNIIFFSHALVRKLVNYHFHTHFYHSWRSSQPFS